MVEIDDGRREGRADFMEEVSRYYLDMCFVQGCLGLGLGRFRIYAKSHKLALGEL